MLSFRSVIVCEFCLFSHLILSWGDLLNHRRSLERMGSMFLRAARLCCSLWERGRGRWARNGARREPQNCTLVQLSIDFFGDWDAQTTRGGQKPPQT